MADDSSNSTHSSLSSCSGSSSEAILDFESSENSEVEIQPYMFEPEGSDSNENISNSDDEMPNSRMTNNDWCQCSFCQRQDTDRECVCCQELLNVVDRNKLSSKKRNINVVPACITSNPGFLSVCVDPDVLDTAWFAYKQQYTEVGEVSEHKRLRHIAYRQFVRWCWGWLGRHIRVILPSCVVSCIKAHFPPPGLEEDFLFEGFHDS